MLRGGQEAKDEVLRMKEQKKEKRPLAARNWPNSQPCEGKWTQAPGTR